MAHIIFLIFLISCSIQVLFYVFVFAPFAFSKPKIKSTVSNLKVSVIIAARNEYENLKNLLPKLEAQEYSKFEVIIINDRSEDKTGEILSFWEKQHDWLKVLHHTEIPTGVNPKKYAISQGVAQASGEIIILTDADCLPYTSKWINSIVANYSEKTGIVLGYSSYIADNSVLNFFIRWETLYTAVQYYSIAHAGIPYMGVGRNLSYRKKLFIDNKGFEKIAKITGGDDDLFVSGLATAENTSYVCSLDSQTVSVPEKSWKDWFKQKRRHLSVGVHYPLKIVLILGVLNVSQIFFYVTLLLLIIVWYKIVIVAAVYLFRMLTVWLVLRKVDQKLNKKNQHWHLTDFAPIFELFYVAYYIVTGLATLTNRNIKWK